MKGTLVNAGSIMMGSIIGLIVKKNIPAGYQQTLMQGLGLTIGFIGLQMALKTQNIMIVILSVVIGGVIGEYLKIETRLDTLGQWLTKRIGNQYGDIGQGFVTASLMFCVGAMAIVGAIQDGFGDSSTLYAKSTLDGIAAMVLSSGMGAGVALSSISVLVYQGSITVLANLVQGIISEGAIREMTAVGGILIVGLSILTLEIKKIRVANLLPAILVAAVLANIMP